jgi:hypothetical protein
MVKEEMDWRKEFKEKEWKKYVIIIVYAGFSVNKNIWKVRLFLSPLQQWEAACFSSANAVGANYNEKSNTRKYQARIKKSLTLYYLVQY